MSIHPHKETPALRAGFDLIVMGFSLVGSLIIGWSAAHYGAPIVVSGCSLICMLAGIAYTLWARDDRSINHQVVAE